MAVYTTINDPSVYFQNTLYTGNGSTAHDITNTGNANLQPDLIWIKNRSSNSNPIIQDTSRGINVQSFTDGNASENTNASWGHVNSVATDGFQVDAGSPTSEANANKNSDNYVAWQWKANGGTTSSNSDGSVTSTVQANTTAGFSVVLYTATGSGDITVGHGLGAVPEMILTKTRSVSYDWRVYASANEVGGAGKSLQLDGTGAQSTNNSYPSPAPTSTVMTMGRGGDDNNNYANGETIVSYCFRSIPGYSKIGSFFGNGSTDGPFIYTGFKPAFGIFKRTNTTGNWYMMTGKIGDDGQDGNPLEDRLLANAADAEGDMGGGYDFVSNGIKVRHSGGEINGNGDTFVYMAFAENPFVTSDSVPTTAR